MIFRRTSSGLSNLYLFVGAEAVIFLEGGPTTFTREKIEDGAFTSISSDIRYWQALFADFLPSRKYQFRSIGSKEAVKSIAIDIKNGSISNVIAIMDRDFDNLSGEIIDGDNILYTYGYSWENDCWTTEAINSAVISLTGLCATKANDVETEVNDLFMSFCKHIKCAVKADSLMIQNGFSLFDRVKPARYISIEAGGKPNLCMKQIKKSFKDSRLKVASPIYKKFNLANSPLTDCFGHLLADFSYRVLIYLIKWVYKLPMVAKDYASAVVIDKYISAMNHGKLPNQKAHYDHSFSRVTA